MKRRSIVLSLLLSTLASAWATSEEVWTTPPNPSLLAQLLILFGSFFILAAAIGVTRFPDFYTRLHASTKLVTLGGVGIFLGTALAFGQTHVTHRMILIAAFFFLTAPLSAYMIARSGYLRGLKPYREADSRDEWGECGRVDDVNADAAPGTRYGKASSES